MRETLKAQVPAELLATFDSEAETLGRAGLEVAALRVGDTAPDFTLPDQDGQPVSLRSLLANGPLVLTFYRGQWCPYCNLQLRAYQQALGEISARGASLVAVSPQQPEYSSSMADANELAFAVLSDADNRAARQYGLVFTIADDMREVYLAAGTDLLRYNGDTEPSWELPVPGTFVIDTAGTVVFAHVDGDYRHRAEVSDILAALDSQAATPRAVLERWLTALGSGDVATLSALLADPVDWDIPGASHVPWAGPRHTPSEVVDAVKVLGSLLTPKSFTLDKIVADDTDAAAFGSFAQEVTSTGAQFSSEFAIRITTANGKITRYRIHEDSHAVAQGVQA
jgi:peroxiredoxin/ketosteroid isomerase-like protein